MASAQREPRVPKPRTQGSSGTASRQAAKNQGGPPPLGGSPAKSTMKNRTSKTGGQRGSGKGAR